MEARTKRIAKNTIMLYCRALITMVIGLFTGRLTLEALGIDNYGIQSVVGSIVAFSSLITGAMTAASSRYITYSLGEGDLNKMRTVFSTSLQVQILLSLIIIVFLEIAGLWFLNCKANIPEDRLYSANWVFQISVISLALSQISVPFNSSIIAHEKMSVYAYASIVEIVLRLGVVYCVINYGGDRLILISNLSFLTSFGMLLFYIYFAKRNFEEVFFSKKLNKPLIKEIFSFSSWSFIGNGTWIFNTQGVNMLINIFFGVAFNATRGIAGTVNGCIQSFVSNFTMAFTPQITKSYAAKEYDYCYLTVNRGTRISWLLQLVFIVPVFLEAETLLSLWLKDVPPMGALFLRFTILESFALMLGSNLIKLIRAHGVIKWIVIKTSLLSMLVFPLVWITFYLGGSVWCSYPIMIAIYLMIAIIYLHELSKLTTYSWRSFMGTVIKPGTYTTLAAFSLPLLLRLLIPSSIGGFFLMVPIDVIWTLGMIYKFGCTLNERIFITTNIKNRLRLTRLRTSTISDNE